MVYKSKTSKYKYVNIYELEVTNKYNNKKEIIILKEYKKDIYSIPIANIKIGDPKYINYDRFFRRYYCDGICEISIKQKQKQKQK